ncbi:amidohydrolase family protein [Pararobbsia silviterrae]|uniref:Amidohydrolase n=1 Tax=Pararobbsia silviterrae TaxID=1792498 RepID=A0A494Y4J8_9BURK|nr:amidohydrolase family protein [Pararobbsia silviterrae]RKP57646.1 amidohydrolase [Pararobbsia silviterrae]
MNDVTQVEPPRLETLHPSPAWLASHREPVLDPDRAIIDPHHHFSHHWGGYGLRDLLDDTGAGHRIEATVYVQCGWTYRETGPELLRPLGETEAVVALAEQARAQYAPTRVAAGIVGYADLRIGRAIEPVLHAQIEAGQGRFRGVRVAASRHPSFQHGVLGRPPEGLYAEPAFREGVRCLGALGLTFDAWIYHPQIPDVVELAHAAPDTTIVLDHVGGILGVGDYAGRRDAAFAEWRASIGALAACPNVVVKIGGYGTRVFGYDHLAQAEAPSSERLAQDWRPSVETVVELFGASRCMFESNFPVDRASASYATVWNAFKRLAAHASDAEKDALFRGTAQRIYRLDV